MVLSGSETLDGGTGGQRAALQDSHVLHQVDHEQ